LQGYHGDLTREEQETLRAVMLLRHQVSAQNCRPFWNLLRFLSVVADSRLPAANRSAGFCFAAFDGASKSFT